LIRARRDVTSPRASATTVAAYGEVMLRLKPPGHERLLQSPAFEVCVGGAEMNVLASLARFGRSTRLVTSLPDDPLGDAALAEIRALGIGTSAISRRAGRMGLYFLEGGQGWRAGQVIYDRAGSAFASDTTERAWTELLADAGHLHLTGITPALSGHTASQCLEAARRARRAGITVSLDINHRAQLWAAADRAAGTTLGPLLEEIDFLFASTRDLQMILLLAESRASTEEAFEDASAAALERLPHLGLICTCTRSGEHSDRVMIRALGRSRAELHRTAERQIHSIADRVGAGDAFAAGVLHRLLDGGSLAPALEFGSAAAALKHSVPGDVNRMSEAEVDACVSGAPASLMRR
jgi:2-dehydro-3-deoxygluconokinase